MTGETLLHTTQKAPGNVLSPLPPASDNKIFTRLTDEGPFHPPWVEAILNTIQIGDIAPNETAKVHDCYGIRAPTRHTLHSPFPRWRTIFLHQRIPHLTGPIPGLIRIRPQHHAHLKPGPFLSRCVFLFHLSRLWSVSLFHRSFGPLVSISYLVCFPL